MTCTCQHPKSTHMGDNGPCMRCHCTEYVEDRQLGFANIEPLARTSDDATSHEAAATLTASGQRDSHKRRVLDAVRSHPGHTACELSRLTEIPHPTMHKRLPDLMRDGLVTKSGTKACDVTGSRATVWVASE